MSKTGKTTYTVSEKTANLLDCIKTANKLTEQIYDSLSAIYGEKYADSNLIGPYETKIEQIKEDLLRVFNWHMMGGLSEGEENTI